MPESARRGRERNILELKGNPLFLDTVTKKLAGYLEYELIELSGVGGTTIDIERLFQIAVGYLKTDNGFTSDFPEVDSNRVVFQGHEDRIAMNAILSHNVLSIVIRDPKNLHKLNSFINSAIYQNSFEYAGYENTYSKDLVSEATIFYVRCVFNDLNGWIEGGVSESSSHNFVTPPYLETIQTVAIIGWAMGYFTDNPNGPRNRAFFRSLLEERKIQLPETIRGAIFVSEIKPFENFLDIWRQFFVVAITAAGRVDSHTPRLHQVDQTLAHALLGSDLQVYPDQRSANRAASLSHARGQTGGQPAEQIRVAQQQEQQKNQSQKKLLNQMIRLLQQLNPSGSYSVAVLLNSIPWLSFSRNAPFIFNEFVTNSKPLLKKKLDQEELAGLWDSFAKSLTTTVDKISTKQNLSDDELPQRLTTSLFGEAFDNLTGVDRVCLIFFAALATSTRTSKEKTDAIGVFSQVLQFKMAMPEPDNPAAVDDEVDWPPQHAPEVWAYRQRLLQLEPEGWRLSSSPALSAEISAAEMLVEPLWRQIRYEGNPEKVDSILGFIWKRRLLVAYYVGVVALPFLKNDANLRTAVSIFEKLYWLPVSLFGAAILQAFNEHNRKGVLSRVSREMRKRLTNNQDFSVSNKQLSSLITKEKINWIFSVIRQYVILALLISIPPLIEDQSWDLNQLFNIKGIAEVGSTNDGNSESQFGVEMPESNLNPESLRNVQPVLQGELLDAPDDLLVQDGDQVAMWPYAMKNSNETTYRGPAHRFENVVRLESLLELELITTSDQFAFRIEAPQVINAPFKGFSVTQVFQVGGSDPVVDDLGLIIYPEAGVPEELVLVMTPLSLTPLDSIGRVAIIDENQAQISPEPWLEWENTYENALNLNQKLELDPGLQSLHLNMINELQAVMIGYNEHGITESERVRLFSDVVSRYAVVLSDYINNTRTYSLLFQNPNTVVMGETIEAVANKPGDGFYCATAADLVSDFFGSVGMPAVSVNAVGLRTYNSRVYSRLGHVYNILTLPNGQQLLLDLTPSRPHPGEDLSMLTDFPPANTIRATGSESGGTWPLPLVTSLLTTVIVSGYLSRHIHLDRLRLPKVVQDRVRRSVESAQNVLEKKPLTSHRAAELAHFLVVYVFLHLSQGRQPEEFVDRLLRDFTQLLEKNTPTLVSPTTLQAELPLNSTMVEQVFKNPELKTKTKQLLSKISMRLENQASSLGNSGASELEQTQQQIILQVCGLLRLYISNF